MKKTALAITACAVLGAANVEAAGFKCARKKELTALHLRSLQSQLMVAALNCGAREDYNSFVLRYNKELIRSGRHLISYFNRNYRGSSQQKLDSFVTVLANEASTRNMDSPESFCAHAKELLDSLLVMDKENFGDFAFSNSYLMEHTPEQCLMEASIPVPLNKKDILASLSREHFMENEMFSENSLFEEDIPEGGYPEEEESDTITSPRPPKVPDEKVTADIPWWKLPIEKLKQIKSWFKSL